MALTNTIKSKFEKSNGVSFRELSLHPSLMKKFFSKNSSKSLSHRFIGRGYPFFGKTIDTKKVESECLNNLKKW